MRNRVFGLLAAIGIALGVMSVGTPALADSTKIVPVVFYNNGYYWAYADIEAGMPGGGVWSDFSGSLGHTGHRWFKVPAHAQWVHWKVRYEPTGDLIREEWLDWGDYNDNCPDGKHATIYVGGLAGGRDNYPMHCSNWGGRPPQD